MYICIYIYIYLYLYAYNLAEKPSISTHDFHGNRHFSHWGPARSKVSSMISLTNTARARRVLTATGEASGYPPVNIEEIIENHHNVGIATINHPNF